MKKVGQTLAGYSEELGIALTLDDLINSHRRIRQSNEEYRTKLHDMLEKAREHGRMQGREEVIHGQYIKYDNLRHMTIQELVEFLA